MKITRKPLNLKSDLYSREYGIERSQGCHVMTIIEHIDRVGGHSRHKEALSERTMEALRTVGYTWEHVMCRTEKVEDALSLEAMRVQFEHRPELIFPGELFWCQQCDDVLQGGEIAREHCKTTGHNGIFLTLDGTNTVRRRVSEFKVTWMSSSRTGPDHIDGIWKWPVQNMSYCYASGYPAGELMALFVCGDYKQSTYEPFPEAYEFDLDYEPREPDECFSMLVNNARAMEWI